MAISTRETRRKGRRRLGMKGKVRKRRKRKIKKEGVKRERRRRRTKNQLGRKVKRKRRRRRSQQLVKKGRVSVERTVWVKMRRASAKRGRRK